MPVSNKSKNNIFNRLCCLILVESNFLNNSARFWAHKIVCKNSSKIENVEIFIFSKLIVICFNDCMSINYCLNKLWLLLTCYRKLRSEFSTFSWQKRCYIYCNVKYWRFFWRMLLTIMLNLTLSFSYIVVSRNA